MARGPTIKIEGLRDVERALGELPKATGKNVLRRVGRARLEPVAEGMRELVPVAQADLKDSIAVTTKNPRRHRRESAVEVHAGPGRHPQGHLQEFGTQHHGPQPFARPAWDREKGNLLPGLADALWEEINKAAQRAARKAARLASRG